MIGRKDVDDYIVAMGRNVHDLIKDVREWIDKGYYPHGDLFYIRDFFHQPMIFKKRIADIKWTDGGSHPTGCWMKGIETVEVDL